MPGPESSFRIDEQQFRGFGCDHTGMRFSAHIEKLQFRDSSKMRNHDFSVFSLPSFEIVRDASRFMDLTNST